MLHWALGLAVQVETAQLAVSQQVELTMERQQQQGQQLQVGLQQAVLAGLAVQQ
jgi:hypothetical protein